MSNLLITCAGRRNYLVNYFKEALAKNGLVITTDMQETAPSLADADRAYSVPVIYKDNYIDVLLDICKIEEVTAVISIYDLELPILSAARSRFEDIDVKLLLSSDRVIDVCLDKWKTYKFALSHGFHTPKTFLSLYNAIKEIKLGKVEFPLVVKPRWGSGSIGIEYVYSFEELKLAYRLLELRLPKTILKNVSQQDYAIIIQEKIEGTSYVLDILNDFFGNPVQVYIHEKLSARAGEIDKAVLRNIPKLEQKAFYLADKLKHIATLDCDFIEKDGKYYLLEMNPRFGGGYPFSHFAGANFPAAIIAWLCGNSYDFSNFSKTYNKILSKYDSLISVNDNINRIGKNKVIKNV